MGGGDDRVDTVAAASCCRRSCTWATSLNKMHDIQPKGEDNTLMFLEFKGDGKEQPFLRVRLFSSPLPDKSTQSISFAPEVHVSIRMHVPMSSSQ